jgi:hypothetical protein
MARRSLRDSLKQISPDADPALAEEFLMRGTPRSAAHPRESKNGLSPPEPDGRGKGQTTVSRSPLTTRIRSDYAAALKRASLERQLKGELPNTILDILEEALKPWLRTHGYLPTDADTPD